jgi:ABC-type Fe3+/spermidine/putrescine transport system ATPase subunit
MTVYENVAYPLKRHRISSRDIPERVAFALQTVGIAEYRDRPAPLLSGGQAQRVALARALVFDPDVLLLDEPLSNLDARLREEMRFELRMLQSRVRVTTIFVTHDQSEAMVLSDRTVVMSMGRIEQVGTPSEVYQQPATRFVMDFLGQVNHLPARITRAPDGTLLACVPDAGDTALPLIDPSARHEDEEVVLAFRPQDVTLRPAYGDTSNSWVGCVEAVAYLGTHMEYRFKLGEADIRVTTPCHVQLTAGAMAVCEIDARAIKVWPVEKGRLI